MRRASRLVRPAPRGASAAPRITRHAGAPPGVAAKAKEARPEDRAWLPRMTIRAQRGPPRFVATLFGRLEAVSGREPVYASEELRLGDIREIEVEAVVAQAEAVRGGRDRSD